jgi:DNA-binding NarL/FixJ family response regulator
MLEKVRVILADDRAAVRSSLRLLLDEEPAFEVVAEAADALELLQVQTQEIVELILIDWELPGLPLPQLLHRLRHQERQLLIVAMSSMPASRQQALDAGADAFVDKSRSPDQMLSTLRALPVKQTRDSDLLTSRPNLGSLA